MAKKAQERIYFKTRELVEEYKVKNPNMVLTRFIKDASDLDRTEWFGYDIQESSQAQSNQNAADNSQTNVPEIA